jgi:hypothetical protein
VNLLSADKGANATQVVGQIHRLFVALSLKSEKAVLLAYEALCNYLQSPELCLAVASLSVEQCEPWLSLVASTELANKTRALNILHLLIAQSPNRVALANDSVKRLRIIEGLQTSLSASDPPLRLTAMRALNLLVAECRFCHHICAHSLFVDLINFSSAPTSSGTRGGEVIALCVCSVQSKRTIARRGVCAYIYIYI